LSKAINHPSYLQYFRNLASQQFDITTDLLSEIRAAREESNRSKINDWLSCPNPSKEHTLARSRHEETTGSWLVEGDEFSKWMNSQNSFLWLYGGGKLLIKLPFFLS
jgi:hypothetical protein